MRPSNLLSGHIAQVLNVGDKKIKLDKKNRELITKKESLEQEKKKISKNKDPKNFCSLENSLENLTCIIVGLQEHTSPVLHLYHYAFQLFQS